MTLEFSEFTTDTCTKWHWYCLSSIVFVEIFQPTVRKLSSTLIIFCFVPSTVQALPIYLDKLFNQYVAIVLSVTFVLAFGEVHCIALYDLGSFCLNPHGEQRKLIIKLPFCY